MIKARDYRKTAIAFTKAFGMAMNEYIDTALTTDEAAFFDYDKFIEDMTLRHPELESSSESVADIIGRHYGRKAVQLIETIL